MNHIPRKKQPFFGSNSAGGCYAYGMRKSFVTLLAVGSLTVAAVFAAACGGTDAGAEFADGGVGNGTGNGNGNGLSLIHISEPTRPY